MLRPIRDFITYLQKNANSATIFGVPPSINEENMDDCKIVASTPSVQLEVEDGEAEEEEKTASDDQITNTSDKQDRCWPEKSHDQNENIVSSVIVSDDDSSVREAMSDQSVTIIEHEVDSDVQCLEENENCENGDITNNGELSIINEVINIGDDSNAPDLTVDDPADPAADPLAIDEYHADISGNTNNSSLHNSVASDLDTSAEGEILFIIDVDIIKKNPPGNPNTSSSGQIVINRDNELNNERFQTQTNKLDEINEEQEVRSDGSDSGLGSDTIGIQSNNNVDTNLNIHPSVNIPAPTRGNLKRHFEDNSQLTDNRKRTKRTIQFEGVTVYYFPRIQGFACVPSQGGCTLGMGSRHVNQKKFTLAEHAAEQRRVHKQLMQDVNPRGSSSDETDSDEEISEASGSDLDADANGFLQPVPTRQRRAILKAAGIRRIDSTEKDECRAIRGSREFCGCSCIGFCDPDTCSCSQARIKCQVDRPNFPCGCTRDGCANVVGRIEFNPSRVRTHFIHTIMRLELDNKQKRTDDMVDGSAGTSSILSYSNTCGSTSNSAVTATISASNNSNISNICNYNNHMRSQPYGHSLLQQLLQPPHTSHDYPNNGLSHNNLYSNNLHNGIMGPPLLIENCVSSSSQHLHRQTQSTIHHNSNTLENNNPNSHNNNSSNNDNICNMNYNNNNNSNNNNSNSNISDGNSPNINHNHQNDMHFAFREVVVDNTSTVSRSNTDNNSILIDFPSTNNQLYHETYNSNSYVNHSYGNSNSSINNNYSSYQQSYINYASSNCNNQIGNEIHDLTSTDDDGSDYINLHPPIANSERLDAINDLLQTNRNTPPAASTSTPAASVNSIKLTDIVPKTKSTQSPSKVYHKNNITSLNFEQKFQDFVDVAICDSIDVHSTDEYATTGEPQIIEDIDTDSEGNLEASLLLSSSSSSASLIMVDDPCQNKVNFNDIESQNTNATTLSSIDSEFNAKASHETDENLGDIIKKSIVETVSA